MGFSCNMCGPSKKEATGVAPRSPYAPSSSAPRQARTAAVAVPSPSPPARQTTPQLATPVKDTIMGSVDPADHHRDQALAPQSVAPAHHALSLSSGPSADVTPPMTPNSIIAPRSASVGKASAGDGANYRESDYAVGRAPVSAETRPSAAHYGSATNPLAHGSTTVQQVPNSSMPPSMASVAARPTTTTTVAASMPVRPTGTAFREQGVLPVEPSVARPAPVAATAPLVPTSTTHQQTSQMPSTRTVPSRTLPSHAAPPAFNGTTTASTSSKPLTPTVPTAQSMLQPRQMAPISPRGPTTRVAQSTPAPRTAQTGTVTCTYSTTKPIATHLYSMPRRGQASPSAAQAAEMFAPLAAVQPDLQPGLRTPLLHNHYASSSTNSIRGGSLSGEAMAPMTTSAATASPSTAMATTSSRLGSRASVPAISQVQTTASVSAASRAARAASLPVAHTTMGQSQLREQTSAVPQRTAPVVGYQRSAAPVAGTVMASHTENRSTKLPEVQTLGSARALYTEASSRANPSAVEAREHEAGDDPAAVQWASATRHGVLPAGHSALVPKSPTGSRASSSMPVSQTASTQYSTAPIEVASVPSAPVSQRRPHSPGHPDNDAHNTVTATLMERSFPGSHTPSMCSGVSQDIWIDASSTQTTRVHDQRSLQSGGTATGTASQHPTSPPIAAAAAAAYPSPESRPSTAKFTDGQQTGSQMAPRGLALAHGNGPLYNVAAAGHAASETARAAPGLSPLATLPPALASRPPLSSTPSAAAAPSGMLSPMDASGFSHSANDHEDLMSPITPPYASVATRTPSEGTPIMRMPPPHLRGSLPNSPMPQKAPTA